MVIWSDFIAGWIGGCAGLIVGHPFDTIKVRMQARTFQNIRKCCKLTVQKEGLIGLYNGLGFPLLTNGKTNCIFFGVYGNIMRYFEKLKGEEEVAQHRLTYVFMAGCIATLPQLVISVPVELVKVLLQADAKGSVYRGPIDCLRSVYRHQGLVGCYRGLTTQIYRDIPANGLYMVVFEAGMNMKERNGSSDVLDILIFGGLAGVISWTVILPLDVVKSRIQADNAVAPRYHGMINCFVQSYREDGMAIFGRGFSLVASRAFITNAVTFLAYKWWLNMFQPIDEDKKLNNSAIDSPL